MGPVLTQQCLADCCRDIKENGRFVFVHITLSFDIQALAPCVFVCACVCRGGSAWCGYRVQLHLPCMSTTGSGADTQEERWLSHHWPHWSCLLSKDNNDHAARLCYGAFRLYGLGAWSVWPPDYLPTEPLYIQAYWTSSRPLVFVALKFPGCFLTVCFTHRDRIPRGGCYEVTGG